MAHLLAQSDIIYSSNIDCYITPPIIVSSGKQPDIDKQW